MLVSSILFICTYIHQISFGKECMALTINTFNFGAGDKSLTAVWDISTWNRIGHKRLLRKSASVMSISHDGKYLSL